MGTASFQKVRVAVDDVVVHFRDPAISNEDRDLILRLNLPGSTDMFDRDPTKAQQAKREFLANFIRSASAANGH